MRKLLFIAAVAALLATGCDEIKLNKELRGGYNPERIVAWDEVRFDGNLRGYMKEINIDDDEGGYNVRFEMYNVTNKQIGILFDDGRMFKYSPVLDRLTERGKFVLKEAVKLIFGVGDEYELKPYTL